MAVAQHEASSLSFPQLSGVFDVTSPKTSAGWLGSELPFSGVMAEAVQTVSITSRVGAENLLAVGTRGHAGYSKRFGGVDVSIDAVLTDNAQTSGAYGFDLQDFESKIDGPLTLITTNSNSGKKISVSGLYVNTINFNFNANDNATTSWGFVGDSVLYEFYDVAASGVAGNNDYHCVDPLTWDEIHLVNGCSSAMLTGVQSATFAATLNRTEVYQIGQFVPYDRTVTHPYNVTVTLNTLSNEVELVNWWQKFVASYDPMAECSTTCGSIIIKVRTKPLANDAVGRDFIIASGLRPTSSTLNTAVGANSTVTLNFEGTSLRF